MDHPNSLLEIRRMTPTCLNLEKAIQFTRSSAPRILFQFDLTKKRCSTAIDVSSFSDFPDEEEVLILPGTFFSVTEIIQDDDMTVISLVNVPVDKSILSTAN